MKKIIIFILILAALLSITITAAAKIPNFTKKQVVLFYDVTDNVLACQNKKEDIVKGQAQLEKVLLANYKKRFEITKVQRINSNKGNYNLDTLFSAPDGQLPLIVRIRLVRSGAARVKATNGLGERSSFYVPTVTSSLQEIIGDRQNKTLKIQDYGEKTLRGMVYTSFLAYDTPQTRSRDSIRSIIKQACEFKQEINKFTNPSFYEHERKRYAGDFTLSYDYYLKLNKKIVDIVQQP